MLSEISQTQRDKYQMLSHTWTLRKYSELITRTDRDWEGYGEGEEGRLDNRYQKTIS